MPIRVDGFRNVKHVWGYLFEPGITGISENWMRERVEEVVAASKRDNGKARFELRTGPASPRRGA